MCTRACLKNHSRHLHAPLCAIFVLATAICCVCLAGVMVACGRRAGQGEGGAQTEIQVFIAASLNAAMSDLAQQYERIHPDVKIVYNADSSGTLLTQIREGYACDLFFSAAQKQMDGLEADGFVREGSRRDVLCNQLVVLAAKGSGTAVRGLESLSKAQSIALAGASVPAGQYTRRALASLGILQAQQDVDTISARDVAKALGDVEISEQDNVGKVLVAVAEGVCEVGTAYYSDTYGYEKRVEVIEKVDTALTGDVVYPACLVYNREADGAQEKAAEAFLEYILSDEAKELFRQHYFIACEEDSRL